MSHFVIRANMTLVKILQQTIILQRDNRLPSWPSSHHTESIALCMQCFERTAHLFQRQQGPLKVNTPGLSCLQWWMSIRLRIQFISQVPLLKESLTEQPRGTIPCK